VAIRVDIKPEIQAELARRAASAGSLVEKVAASLLREAVRVSPQPARLSEERMDRTLREMAIFSHKIPALPDEAFTREFFYRDPD